MIESQQEALVLLRHQASTKGACCGLQAIANLTHEAKPGSISGLVATFSGEGLPEGTSVSLEELAAESNRYSFPAMG